jgi:hypothetical protein
MFAPEEGERIRERVLPLARADQRITGGALTGSHSVGTEDRWSDVDTAFGVAAGVAPEGILRDWTQTLSHEFDVVHYFDLRRGTTIYRVFLLSNSLELDVSLTPAVDFGPHGPLFGWSSGKSAEPSDTPALDVASLIGFGWIYVLNARAALERGRPWQAERWISGIRDQSLALACVRHGLPAAQARGVDQLPADVTSPWDASLVRSLELGELRRALSVAAPEFVREVELFDPRLAERLREPLALE